MTLRYWKKVALCLKLSVWCHILLQRLHNLNIRSHFLEMVSWSAWKSWKPVCWSCTTQVGRKEAPHRPSRSLSEQKTTKQARMPKSRHCLYQTTNRFVSDHWFESDRWSDCGQEKDLLILVIYYSVVSCNERSIQSRSIQAVHEFVLVWMLQWRTLTSVWCLWCVFCVPTTVCEQRGGVSLAKEWSCPLVWSMRVSTPHASLCDLHEIFR